MNRQVLFLSTGGDRRHHRSTFDHNAVGRLRQNLRQYKIEHDEKYFNDHLSSIRQRKKPFAVRQ